MAKKSILTPEEKVNWDDIRRIQARRREVLKEHRANHWRGTVKPKRESIQDACFRLLEPITPIAFYNEIFRVADEHGLFGLDGETTIKSQYTAILKKIPIDSDGEVLHKKTRRVTVTAGCPEIYDTVYEATDFYDLRKFFCFMNPILFAGKKSSSKNARWLCALAIDIDHIYEAKGIPQGVYNLLTSCVLGEIPTPTYIVCSGTGLHAYYVLKEPVPLFERNKRALDSIRKKLIRELWLPGHGITNLLTLADIQYESLTQNFRVPGTLTKAGYKANYDELQYDYYYHGGRTYWTHAYKIGEGERISIEDLISWVADSEESYKSMYLPKKESYSYDQLMELWPDWTRRHFYTDSNSKHYKMRRPPSAVLAPKKAKGKVGWKSHRSLYDWWLRKAAEVLNGHRYHYCLCLAAYAQKCNLTKEEFKKDVESLYEIFKEKDTGISRWNKSDEADAIACYDTPYLYRLGIDRIEKYSGIHIEKHKKNGLPREKHLFLARQRKEAMKLIGIDFKHDEGRPSKEKIVYAWRQNHPEGTKYKCIKETGLSKHTVYKWWDFIPQPEADGYDFEEKKEVILKKL